jgi:hypothetical protein
MRGSRDVQEDSARLADREAIGASIDAAAHVDKEEEAAPDEACRRERDVSACSSRKRHQKRHAPTQTEMAPTMGSVVR